MAQFHRSIMAHSQFVLKQANTIMSLQNINYVNSIEKEENLLFHCNFYNQLRENIFSKARAIQNNFLSLPVDKKKIKILISEQIVKDMVELLYS